ncbi:MAG: hypothetical protein ABSE76_02475 [Minisyncoccia bacterium]
MLNRIEQMNTSSIDKALQAARWIGWIFAHAELNGLLSNSETRTLIRTDREKGFDKPHSR